MTYPSKFAGALSSKSGHNDDTCSHNPYPVLPENLSGSCWKGRVKMVRKEKTLLNVDSLSTFLHYPKESTEKY